MVSIEEKKDLIAQIYIYIYIYKIARSPTVQLLARDNKVLLFMENININMEAEKKKKHILKVCLRQERSLRTDTLNYTAQALESGNSILVKNGSTRI